MDDTDAAPRAPPPGRREPEPPLRELVDLASRRLVTGLVIAGAAIGLAIYARPGPPRYEAIAAPDGRIIRIDTRSGTVLSCEGRTCMIVVRRGQRLERNLPAKALPAGPGARGAAASPARPGPGACTGRRLTAARH